MITKTTTKTPTTPASTSNRIPGIIVRSGLRGGDTEKAGQSTSTTTSTTGNAAIPHLIIIK